MRSKYIKIYTFIRLLFLIVLCGILAFVLIKYSSLSITAYAISGTAAIFFVIFFYNLAKIKVYEYKITPDNIYVYKGILTKHTLTIPIRRIQHVSYHQNIIERKSELASVVIVNGGAVQTIKYVNVEKAKEFSEYIITMLNRYIENDDL